MPNFLADLWHVKNRNGMSIFEPSFAHLGGFVSASEQRKLLEYICSFAAGLVSTYDEPDEYAEGDFFISDMNRKEPEIRIILKYGNYSVKEIERERAKDY